jgi:MFS family permease
VVITPDRTEVRVVAGTTLIYGSLFLDRLAPLYLIVIVRAELGLSAGALALLPVSIGLGWASSMALGHWLSGRISDRSRIALGAGGAALLHLVSAQVAPWWAFLLLRFLGGVLAGTVAPPITALVFRWAPAARRGLDIGIVFSATRLFGSLVSPIVVLAIAVRAGWQTALGVSAAGLLLSAMAFLVLVPTAPAPTTSRHERRAEARTTLRPGGRRDIALASGVGILLVTWLTVVSQSGPTVVVDALGVTPDQAGTVVGAFGIGGWLAALAVPALSDRIGRPRAVGGATSLGAAAGLTLSMLFAQQGAVSPWLPAVLLGIGGVAMGALPLALSIIPGEAVLRGDPGRAVAWPVVGSEIVGSALLPGIALLGFLPDRLALGAAGAGLLLATGLASAFSRPPA